MRLIEGNGIAGRWGEGDMQGQAGKGISHQVFCEDPASFCFTSRGISLTSGQRLMILEKIDMFRRFMMEWGR